MSAKLEPEAAQKAEPDGQPVELKKSADGTTNNAIYDQLRQNLSGGYSRRAWVLLGERVFSHPRYAMLIVAALALCAFERYVWVMLPLALFFSTEWCLRLWLQKENGWRNKTELLFLTLDGIATLCLFSALLMPANLLAQGFYLRLARLLRGMYLLRMLRIFRFLTHDTFVYSLPFGMLVIALAGIALAAQELSFYIAVVLLLETFSRGFSAIKVLPEGKRRNIELSFLPLDIFAAVAVTGLIPGLSVYWVTLRLARFLIMLNPLDNVGAACRKVAAMPAVRSEFNMLAGMLLVLLFIGSMSVIYLYPEMDINDDGAVTVSDYAPFQIILFVFRIIMDPGSAPPVAFSPWLVGLTVFLVIAGVFFFALVVGLGSNVMHYLLRELANSPLSAREHLLFVGANDQAVAILKQLDRLCVRMRRSFASAWIFFGEPLPDARTVGAWMTVRQVEGGERGVNERFQLKGIRQLFFFHRADGQEKQQDVIDMHHLKRDMQVEGVVVSDAALPERLHAIYTQSLNMRVFDSAAVAARMLYQMHHCAYMPELGIRLLDVVDGEIGLFSLPWPLTVKRNGAAAMLSKSGDAAEIALEVWLTQCFEQGVNVLAAMNEAGEPVLFSDLMRLDGEHSFSDIVAIGHSPSLWNGVMTRAMQDEAEAHQNILKTFAWPENWDLSMMFLGWHQGLPAMVEEMALKHHKLTVHVFSTADEASLTRANRQLQDAVAAVGEACKLQASVHAWDGFDTELLVSHLRGCKVMMFYPEDRAEVGAGTGAGAEDSLLELWYHEVSRMLSGRKAKAKWWTPPKLMVLPRQGANVASFVQSSLLYPLLETHVGSPDAFHDVFMARRLLNEACRHSDAEGSARNDKVFRFVEAMLGDAVLVESVSTTGLLDEGRKAETAGRSGMNWLNVYRESLRRGWLLMGYLMPHQGQHGWQLFERLDSAFPSPHNDHMHAMHLLGGVPVNEMDLPLESDELLFCRRGVLAQEAVKEKKETKKVEQKVEKKVEPKAVVEADDKIELPPQIAPAPETIAVQGQVMAENSWPAQADKRLLDVLGQQVAGSVQMLEASSEDALMKLMEVLDMGVSEEVEGLIMAALTDLQHIDRVNQRLNNVRSTMHDWAADLPYDEAAPCWLGTMESRFVMQEERLALKDVLAAVPDADVETATEEVVEAVVEEVVETVVEETVEEVVEAVVEETVEEVVEAVVEETVEEVTEMVAQEIETDVTTDGIAVIEEKEEERENILEGEVMADSVWPKVADKRLIKVLEKQVHGSITLLEESAEDGLIKLTEVLDLGVSPEVEDRIMAALTDLQNIDRVSQRMNNVKSCLQDWGNAAPQAPAIATWKEAVEKRYVMEEERMALKEEL
ncbi:MAG: hypothetical protein JKY87_07230 [Mariprofundus sp.]|nr:hypothetical protein [Mariprofundus sp.]